MKKYLLAVALIFSTGLAWAGSAANVGTSIGAVDQPMVSITFTGDGSHQTTAYKQLSSTGVIIASPV